MVIHMYDYWTSAPPISANLQWCLTYKGKKIHSCFPPGYQQVFWRICHITTTVIDALLGKASSLLLNWPQGWLPLFGYNSAGATRWYHPLWSWVGGVSISILVLNFSLCDRDYQEFYWKIASSALNLIFLLYMLQNPSLGLFGRMTSGHPIICHFPLIFPRFFQSPSPPYFISFFEQKKYKTSNVSHYIQMDTQFGRWPSDFQIRKPSFGLSSVKSLSCVQLFVTPWIAAHQASLSITNSRSSLKLMSIELVMPSNHLILCILFPSCSQFFPASGSFQMSQLFSSGGQSLGVSASTSVLPMNTQHWSPLGWTGWSSLQSNGLSTVFSNTTVQRHQFFGDQLSFESNSHIHTRLLEKP